MPEQESKGRITVVSACMRSDELPDLTLTEVEVTPEEYENRVHILMVEESLAGRGYQEPFVHFEENAAPDFLLPAVRAYLGLATADNTQPATH